MNNKPDISKDSLETLTKRFNALWKVLESREYQIRKLQEQLKDLREKCNENLLESERKANEILTNEIECLKQKLTIG